jgi:hypothetical protein
MSAYRIGGQVVDQGAAVSGQPVFVVDTADADPSNWTVEAATTTAADGTWSVIVPSGDLDRYHAVTQFEDSGTTKNAESKPFVTAQPVLRAVEIPIQFNIPAPQTIGNAIPDSVVLQYYGTTYTGGSTTWSDDTGTSSMSLTGGETAGALSDGSDAVVFDDANNDHGLVTLPPSLSGSSLTSFSVETAIQYTNTDQFDRFMEVSNGADDQQLSMSDETGGTGTFRFLIQDLDSNVLEFEPSTDPGLDDGNRHNVSVIINDSTTNDVDIIIDGTSISVNVITSGSPSNFGPWDTDLGISTRSSGGSVDLFMSASAGAYRFHDSAISSQTISDY